MDERLQETSAAPYTSPTSQSIEWWTEGQTRIVEIDGHIVAVRLVGRKGRRVRIAITGPPGATYRTLE